jgi:hypothetical protein
MVDAAENNLRITCFSKTKELRPDFSEWETAALSSTKRDDAVGAKCITSILDLENGPGPESRHMVDGNVPEGTILPGFSNNTARLFDADWGIQPSDHIVFFR